MIQSYLNMHAERLNDRIEKTYTLSGPEAARDFRHMVEADIDEIGHWKDELKDRLALFVTEIANNAFDHGRGLWKIVVRYDPEHVRVLAYDKGKGFDLDAVPEPGPEDPRGRGLKMMKEEENANIHYFFNRKVFFLSYTNPDFKSNGNFL